MNRLRKFLAFVLAIVCVCSLSVSAFAEGTELNSKAVSTKTKAIVIIPGILGSSLETTSGSKVWLHITNYGKMALTENGTSVYSIRSANYDNYGANNTYKTLYNSLNNAFGNNFDVILFDYDFRKTNSTAATQLANELSNYNEVVLVAHSMGGLVASKFLANSSSNRSKTTALITLGTPFVGAAKCIDVMETGNMITYNPLGVNISLFKNTIRDMSKNCYAAYQLLPTSKYYTKTGTYPLSVNGTNYSNATTQLKNTAWGKKSDGSVKPMFDTATTFHSSLFSGTTHITIQLWHHPLIGEAFVFRIILRIVRTHHGEFQTVEPVSVRGCLSFFHHIFKGEKMPAAMIEHAVDQNADSPCMKHTYQMMQCLVAAKARVNVKIIQKIVFVVLSCHKDGIQVYAVHAQLFQIVNIVGNTPQCAAQFAAYGLTMIVNGSILNGNAFDP